MLPLRAIVFGAVLLAGCGNPTGPHDLDDWMPLLAVQEPVRYSAGAQAVDDASCLKPEGVKVIGDIDANAMTEIINAVRVKHARAAIVMVRGRGRYAEVWTGAECHGIPPIFLTPSLGVMMISEVSDGKANIYSGVQARGR